MNNMDVDKCSFNGSCGEIVCYWYFCLVNGVEHICFRCKKHQLADKFSRNSSFITTNRDEALAYVVLND